ncbi:unnamed protein product [Mytilus coruscus]|uniref:B box-type domain-containing protein n=1 Tax=Mytilus coruscus TaxID=42192 RepID=A0A6J8BIF5_MYTCO|nr:unnamed protein product [Mytilus coruscus]
MDSNQKFCTICSKRHISKPSKEWCTECNQAFCTECKECHSLMSISENHMTIPIDRYDELRTSILSIDNICENHREKYELYCQTHDKLLCLTCIEEHSECKDIKSINKIAKNIKTSESFNEVRMSLEDIDTNIDKMISEIKSNQNSAKDCRGIIIQQIFEIRDKLNKHLDTLELRLKEELYTLVTKAENDMQRTLKYLEKKKLLNITKQKQMEDITKYAADLQTFLGLRHLSSDVQTEEAIIQSLLENGSLDKVEISFELDENITSFSNSINKLGSVQLRKYPCSIRLESQKGKQAQNIEKRNSLEDIVVKFVHSINTAADSITGCDFLPDGSIVMCNYPRLGDDFICVFDSNGSLLKTISVKPNYAFSVVALDKQIVAVSSPQSERSSIMSINIRYKEMSLIETKCNCYSVTFTDGKFQSISPAHGIITIDAKNGKTLSTIQKDLPYNASLTSFEYKLYFCDPSKNTISSCDMEGNNIWSFKDDTVIKKPSGIAVDGMGNVYVTNEDLNNVIVISSDGNQRKQLLSESDGLDKPRAIQYDRNRNRLLVANTTGKAFLFDILR